LGNALARTSARLFGVEDLYCHTPLMLSLLIGPTWQANCRFHCMKTTTRNAHGTDAIHCHVAILRQKQAPRVYLFDLATPFLDNGRSNLFLQLLGQVLALFHSKHDTQSYRAISRHLPGRR
jgi:hypothetical protein